MGNNLIVGLLEIYYFDVKLDCYFVEVFCMMVYDFFDRWLGEDYVWCVVERVGSWYYVNVLDELFCGIEMF